MDIAFWQEWILKGIAERIWPSRDRLNYVLTPSAFGTSANAGTIKPMRPKFSMEGRRSKVLFGNKCLS